MHLSIRGHTVHTGDDANAKMILTALPPENWKRPQERPCITWLNTIQRDLRAYNLTLNKAVNLAQNHPLWRLMSAYGAALLVVHAGKEEVRKNANSGSERVRVYFTPAI